MMRRTGIVGLAILLIISMISSVSAFGPFGGKNDDGKKPDVDGLTKRSATLLNNVQSATISFAEGIVLVQMACGQKSEAEKLQQSIANAKEKKGDKNATKALVGDVNNAAASLNKVELAAQMNKEKAKDSLGNSILKIGVGVILDGIAAKNATTLLQEAQAALKQVSWGAAGKVKEIIDVAQFVTQEIPPQANNLQQYSGKLVDYATTNGIPTPSTEAIKKQADAQLSEG
ncbi:MAG TPA: hypothetical protein PKZ83_17870 [bacterium]|nr:hypothetical protein [bacterium]